MARFKKGLLIKVISVFIAGSFLFTQTSYASPIESSNKLRVPVSQLDAKRTNIAKFKAFVAMTEGAFRPKAAEKFFQGQRKNRNGSLVLVLNKGTMTFEVKNAKSLPSDSITSNHYEVYALKARQRIDEHPQYRVILVTSPMQDTIHARNWQAMERPEVWFLKIGAMSEDDIKRCMMSLGKEAAASAGVKRAIIKKLEKLQQKRPETIGIMREKGLELLNSDERSFRDALMPFVPDYIAIRDAIGKAGITGNTEEFYDLFRAFTEIIEIKTFEDYEFVRKLARRIAYMDIYYIKKAVSLRREGKGVRVTYERLTKTVPAPDYMRRLAEYYATNLIDSRGTITIEPIYINVEPMSKPTEMSTSL